MELNAKWLKNYDKTLSMPEGTAEELRDKINCFTACEIEITKEQDILRNQYDIARSHIKSLFLKLRDKLQDPKED